MHILVAQVKTFEVFKITGNNKNEEAVSSYPFVSLNNKGMFGQLAYA